MMGTGLNPGYGPLLSGAANTWYLPAIGHVLSEGDKVVARGKETYEILHATTQLGDPRQRVLTVPFRRANPFFQAAETVWILAGRSDAAWITKYNSQLGRFLDEDAGHFHGAYGERLRRWGRNSRLKESVDVTPTDQLRDVVSQLLQDRGSRRAVAVLHIPTFDNPRTETKDRPCNIALSFQLRNGALHAATFNRSNDLNLGLAYTNIVQFTTIQEFLAAMLGVDVGTYTHFSSSLHVYTDDPIVQRLRLPRYATEEGFDIYDHVNPTPMAMGQAWGQRDMFQAMEALADGILTSGSIPCPYWGSIAQMLRAWDDLQKEEPVTGLRFAMAGVYRMQTPDWRTACLEYLHRWACRRGLQGPFMESLKDNQRRAFTIGTSLPPAALSFVTHDDVKDLAHA